MPSFKIHSGVVIRKTRMRRPVAIVCDGEGRAITPIIEVTRYGAIVVELGHVVEREAVAEGQGNGRLLCSGLAEAIGRIDSSPIERRLISPVILCAVAIGLGRILTALEV